MILCSLLRTQAHQGVSGVCAAISVGASVAGRGGACSGADAVSGVEAQPKMDETGGCRPGR